ncbi:MAG TPA: DUF58 domain-containing protein [Actinomycetota bacterium]|nr:DUF58 domain-containing protein [Actinomycetota bacterium]
MSSTPQEAFDYETSLRQLELTVTHKLEGLLHGEYQAPLAGPGFERGESRQYEAGDDARRIDWNVTARMNEVYVRQTIADRELETWLVIDASASLDFGTNTRRKRELALIVAGAFGLLGARAGNRVGALVFDGGGRQIIAPRAGRKAVMQLLWRIDQRPVDASQASLADALRTVRATARRRGRVVVISDLIDEGPWAAELRTLAARHDVIVAEVSDPREWSLPAAGLLTLVDPETGRRLEVQTSDPRIRARFAEVSAGRRREVQSAVRGSGARFLEVSTDRDWMVDLVRFVTTTRRGA